MGSKRAYGPAILGALGLHPGQGCDLALVVDAGPWGWAWQHLFQADTARSVAAQLRAWRGEDPVGLWRRLAAEPPPGDLIDGLATWLWLQARSANACPVWWDDTGWRMGDKPWSGGAKGAIQRGHHADPDHPHIQWGRRPAAPGEQRIYQAGREIRPKGTGRGTERGMIDPGTIAARIEAIAHQVAAYLCLQAGAALSRPVVVRDGRWKTAGYGHISESARECGFVDRFRPDMIVACHARAEDCVPQGDLDGWVAILDSVGGRSPFRVQVLTCHVPGMLEVLADGTQPKTYGGIDCVRFATEAIPVITVLRADEVEPIRQFLQVHLAAALATIAAGKARLAESPHLHVPGYSGVRRDV
jgi:hypothetical protein